ncbi:MULTISPECIES: hypothetical protein [Clostridium]|uniref:Peptidase propeptide and YPEB domain protein n=1 Tax=Clostridium cibarium TaxID=2762247 RepID=A0ABR8PNK6_9CLOT|nr:MULTISPECIES: hypothetical protein [Clostridium]MBD7909750.1 hypothetical protein [Clostridium cibarium]
MNYKKTSIVVFTILAILTLCAVFTVYMFIGSGAKEKKSAKAFLQLLSSNNIITMNKENDKYKSTKKSDPSKNEEYYSVVSGEYAIDVDAKYNVIGFTNKNSMADKSKITADEAKSIGEKYLGIIYKGECRFKEVVKEEETQVMPYYSLLFTKYKDGYPFYNYNLSLKVNKETGKLDGFSNSSIDKEPKNVKINIDELNASEISKGEFLKLYKSAEFNEKTYKAYSENKDKTELELCYVVSLKGLGENNKEIKMKYFVSTETGDIINSEKSNVTGTSA